MSAGHTPSDVSGEEPWQLLPGPPWLSVKSLQPLVCRFPSSFVGDSIQNSHFKSFETRIKEFFEDVATGRIPLPQWVPTPCSHAGTGLAGEEEEQMTTSG